MTYALSNELGCQDRFSRPRSPCHQDTISLGNAAPKHLVQFGESDGKAPCAGHLLACPVSPRVREKACNPALVMRKVCSPGTDACPRSFTIWSFRTMEFRSERLVEPKEAIGDREHRVVADFTLDIFTDQKSRGLPTGQKQG